MATRRSKGWSTWAEVDQRLVWDAIDRHRGDLVRLLNGLDEQDWSTSSLCEGWSVRDVLAHLTLAESSAGALAVQTLRARGRVNRGIHDAAVRRAGEPVEILLRCLASLVGSRRHIPGVTPLETLVDVLVHSQDIARPLQMRLPLPPDVAAVAGTAVWRTGWPFHARHRYAGIELRATDTDWRVGEGVPLSAPMEELLLALTGRPAAVPVPGRGEDRAAGT